MEEKTYKYLLFDDNGASHTEMPVVLAIGSIFHHAYGTYRVQNYYVNDEDGDFEVVCDRLYNAYEMTFEQFLIRSENYNKEREKKKS